MFNMMQWSSFMTNKELEKKIEDPTTPLESILDEEGVRKTFLLNSDSVRE